MTFDRCLADYMSLLNCTPSELAQASEVSRSVISRYLSGSRIPSGDGNTIRRLAHGISVTAQRQGRTDVSEEEAYEVLFHAVSGIEIDYSAFVGNLNLLVKALNIPYAELARTLNYDPSYISRVLSGQRKPGNLPVFLSDVSECIARRSGNSGCGHVIGKLTGVNCDGTMDLEERISLVRRFLGSNTIRPAHPAQDFLVVLDEFDLEKYTGTIPSDELILPPAPFRLPYSKAFCTLREMMDFELEFLRQTVLSDAQEDVFIYSEMPLEQMSKDYGFYRRWINGVALVLKKGLHINIIHNVDRPFQEMLVGLQGWIPMYMTGQISPYYFREKQSQIFLQHLKTSGAAALSGEAIAGHPEQGLFSLSDRPEDVAYYRNKARLMLEKAEPLMGIFTFQRRKELRSRLEELAEAGNRRMIFSTIPVFVLPEAELREFLRSSGLDELAMEGVLEYAQRSRREMSRLLEAYRVTMELPDLTEEQFERNPVSLSVPELFYDTDLYYTYPQYRRHLEQAHLYAQAHPNCTLQSNASPAFRNINITVIEGRAVLVSRSKSPTIHFLIRHPKMIEAFQRFSPE